MRYNKDEQKFDNGEEKMKERIDTILVKKGYFTTRQKAKYAIENDMVCVNKKCINKASKLIEDTAQIEITGEGIPYVSRGGLKLEKAIQVFQIQLKDKIAMDIGASTGGFTDCMLKNGTKKIYAIDVGHDQLDENLKQDKRVVNLEGINIKEIDTKSFEKVDFISIDVSFISLTQVLDKAFELLKIEGELVILIKPQFEAGKEYLNKNGVVKDAKIHLKVIEKVLLYANSLSLTILDLDYSPIKGPAGNIEYIAYLKKQEEREPFDVFNRRIKIKEIVDKAYKELK